MKNSAVFAAIPFTTLLLLAGCGGSSSGGDPSTPSTPTPPVYPPIPPAELLPATSAGMWDGTTGTNRTISGVVTKEGNYWLAYSSVGNAAVPAGFYAGQAAPESGSFSAPGLREFNFESGGAQQGTLTSTYTQSLGYTSANTLAGSFGSVTVGNTYGLTATGKMVNATGGGDILLSFSGTWDADANAGTWAGTIAAPALASSGDGLIHVLGQSFTMNEADGKGLLASALLTNCSDPLGGVGCASLIPSFKGQLRSGATNTPFYDPVTNNIPNGAQAAAFVPVDGLSVSWLLRITDATTTPITYTYNPLTVTLTAQSLPSITADTFTSTYNVAYEAAPTLAAVAGAHAGVSGVGNAMDLTGAAFNVDATTGAVTGGSTGTGGCTFSGSLAPHSTGNVYDVTFNFTPGGSCTYTGAFTGAAYLSASNKLTVTLVDSARNKGFLFVAN